MNGFLSEVGSSFEAIEELNLLKYELLSQGKEIIDLSMINPDIKPDRFLIDKLLEAVNKTGAQKYAVARGIRRLREAFAYRYSESFAVDCCANDEVCVTLGSKDAFLQILKVINCKGAEVLLPRPYYPAHLSMVELVGAKPVFFEVSNDEELMLTEIQSSLQSHQVKLIILNFPSNPTGQVVSANFYENLVKLAREHNSYIVNDFVYGEMLYSGGGAVSLLAANGAEDSCLEVFSMSKAYCVPGWRLGAVLGNKDLISKIARLKSLVDYGTYLPIQFAAAAALNDNGNLVNEVVSTYKARAVFLKELLDRIGWVSTLPAAGCSLWVEVPDNCYGLGSSEFCCQLLQDFGICFMPGASFGSEFDSYVRIALVATEDRLHRVGSLLTEGLKKYDRVA